MSAASQLLEVPKRAKANAEAALLRPAAGASAAPEESIEQLSASVARDVAGFFRAHDVVVRSADEFATEYARIAVDAGLTDVGKTQAVELMRDGVDGRVADAFNSMERHVSQIESALDRASVIQRPPVSVEQIAQIGNLHSKWRMVLDRLDPQAATDRLVTFAEDALKAGDQLASWALLEDDWPALYVESRGESPSWLRLELAKRTAPHLPPLGAEALRIRSTVIDGPAGLTSALLATRHWAHRRLRAS